MAVTSSTVEPGADFVLDVEGQWAQHVQGFSLSIAFTPDPPVKGFEVTFDQTLVGELDPEYVFVQADMGVGEVVVAVAGLSQGSDDDGPHDLAVIDDENVHLSVLR